MVVDWIAFTPQHVQTDIDLFQGRVGQYIFISSAPPYAKPGSHHVITEDTPQSNPFSQYASDKIACEEVLRRSGEADLLGLTGLR